MKKLCVLLLMSFFLFVSCSKEESISTPSISCTDGIQNGLETGIDCGGADCIACPTKEELILGDWKVEEFISNGVDHIGANREALYWNFLDNGQLPTFSHFSNGVNAQGNREYFYFDNGYDISFYFDGPELVLANCDFRNSNNTLILTGSWNGFSVDARLERVTQDLCAAVDCNTGACFYGYCICQNDAIGLNCDIVLGPAGGIVIYDKGFVSDGWRYMEASRKVFDEQSQSCSPFGFPIETTEAGIGTGLNNTIAMANLCTDNEPELAINTAGLYTQNGYSNWHLPSQDELGLLIPYTEYLEFDIMPSSYKLHSSTNSSAQFNLRLWVSNDNQWWGDLKGIAEHFVVVRYY